MYPPDLFLVSADVDSSHASCKLTCRSTGGHNITLGDTTVLLSFKLQQLVLLSSTEVECIKLSYVAEPLNFYITL